MKRSLVIGGTILLTLIVIILGVTLSMDRIVRTTIESMGSDMLRVPLQIDDVSISILSGKGSITGISIPNPEQFDEGNALIIGSVDISMDPWSMFSDTIHVEELVIDQLVVTYDLQQSGSNLGQLQTNLSNYSEGREPMEKGLVIDRLLMEETTLTARTSIGGVDPITVTLPSVEHTDIGYEGNNMNDVIATVLNLIIQEVSGDNFRNLIMDEGERLLRDAEEALRERLMN